MSKEKDLIKNTAIITIGKICTQFVSFLLLPLYTAILSAEDYGTVDLVLTYSTLFLPVMTLAIDQALFRYLIDVRADETCKEALISTAVIFTVVQCLISIVFINILRIFIVGSIWNYFIYIFIVCIWSSLSLQMSRGLGDNVGYTLASTLTAIVQVLCNILFLVVFKLGIQGMILSIFIGNTTCVLTIFFRCRIYRYIKVSKVNRKYLKDMLRYSLPMIPNQISWWALHASDKVIVQVFLGVTGNGLLAIANKFSGIYIQFSTIFNVSWTESAALHIYDEDAESFFTQTITFAYKIFLCMCCGIIASMPLIFPILINKQYDAAYGLIPIFMIASLFNVVVSLYGVIYVAHKKTIEIAKTSTYAAIINICTHLFLIEFVGLYASAISTMVGYGCMAFYRYFHSRKYLNVRFSGRVLTLTIIMLFISLFSYYSSSCVVHIFSLLCVIIITAIWNKEIIIKVLSILKSIPYNKKRI